MTGHNVLVNIVKPDRLHPGDTVMVVTTSWGGPDEFPHIFDAGVRVLRETFGLTVKEAPCARWSVDRLRANPQTRAEDLMAAFADPEIKAIFSNIGGDDSARLLKHLDPDVIRANPKIFMGYSDTSTQLVFGHSTGLVTFNGISVMAGFAQLPNFASLEAHVRSILFEPTDTYTYQPFSMWAESYDDWADPTNNGRIGDAYSHDGWHWLNGAGTPRGRLWGGCAEVLEFLKGTRYWPGQDFWAGRMLFLETSEDKPTIEQVRYWLFNYGVQGVFDQAAGLLVGRARDYSHDAKQALDEMIMDVVVGEFGATDLSIVSNLDFGHTDPQWILPLGVMAELDHNSRVFSLAEPAVN
jgi:muramoyltetrapeptide carboxypeptidase LdcA involved in peptidoglycan recycling